MAISFIGSTAGNASAGSFSVTYPAGIQAGDYILVFEWSNTVTIPALLTGYTNISTQGANSNALRMQYKVATGTEGGTSLSVTANGVQLAVYRGVTGIGGASSGTNVASTTTTIPGIATMTATDGSSWVLSYCASKQSTSQSTPAGTTIRGAANGTAGSGGLTLICDSNAGVASWAQHTSTAGASAVGAGGSVELLTTSGAAATLVDAFNKATLTTTLWTQTTLGSAAFSYSTTGATLTYPASTTTSMDGELNSINTYNLTGSSVYLHVISVASGAASTDNIFRLRINNSNHIDWMYEGGSIYAQQMVAGTQTNLFNVAYDSTSHAYWQLRESGGTTFWDTSPDGTTWTNQFSKANPITVTALTAVIAGTAWAASTSPGTFKWNNLNTTGAVATPATGQFFAFM